MSKIVSPQGSYNHKFWVNYTNKDKPVRTLY